MRSSLLPLLAALLFSGCPEIGNRPAGPDAGGGGPDGGGGNRFAQSFTSKEDFQKGTYNGISDDTSGELQMAIGQSMFATPYLWVPNSTENTVSAIDTLKNEVVGTYPLLDPVTQEPCYNPSRTTVDFNFDCWVGCRGTSSYLDEYGGEPVSVVDTKVMKVSLKEGKVVQSIQVGHAPRALALDARGHLWVGNSVDDTVWELDGETGECLRGDRAGCKAPAVKMTCDGCVASTTDCGLSCDFPYGSVVDQKGMLWIACRGYAGQDGRVAKIDTATGTLVASYGPFKTQTPSVFGAPRGGCHQIYGIGVDQLGDVWVGGFTCNDILKLSGKDGSLLGVKLLGGQATRGVAVDLDGNVWAASSGTSTVTKVEGATGNLLKTVDVPSGPIGVAVDAYGHLWAVSQGANKVTKINGVDGSKKEVAVGQGPYSYSDMLGLSLRTVTLGRQNVATWRVVVDARDDASHFTEVKWSVDVPANTGFAVRVRCASEPEDLPLAAWSGDLAGSPAAVDSGGGSCVKAAPQRYLEAEARFTATSTSASPTLHDFTAYWER